MRTINIFLTDPVASCGLLTDPVSKRRFRPQRGSPRATHDGVMYLFIPRSAQQTDMEITWLVADLVLRKFMVNPMNGIGDLLVSFGSGWKMENKSMYQVFNECE